jgi:uncharacterized membrane protein
MVEEIEHTFSKARIESLTDALFATVMTILVLSLVVPVVAGPNIPQQLNSAILLLIPNLFAYVASFIVLGVVWIGHNNIMRYVHKIDRKFQWLTLLFLLSIGVIPFSTAFLGKYPLQQPAIIIYGFNFLIVAIMFNILAYHAMHHHKLIHKDADIKQINIMLKSNFLSVIVYLLSLIFSFINPYISLSLFVFMPIYYISRGIISPD